MRFFSSLLLLICTFGSISLPATGAPNISASIHSEVNQFNGVFTFQYTLSNGSTSSGAIWTLSVDVSRTPGDASLDKDDLVDSSCVIADLSEAIASHPLSVQMLSVALKCPPTWLASLSTSGMASWVAIDETSLVNPGQILTGYRIDSHGLPGLRIFRLEPHFNVDEISIIPPEDSQDLARYQSELRAFIDNASAKGITVGPVAPPADFQPIQFLQAIQNYKEESLKQGWIRNPGVANSLDVKLNTALMALQGQDTTAAKNELNALLNEIHAQDGKQLTTEAVALLQFNTEYLLSKIP